MEEETLPKLEERILRFWKDKRIFAQSLSARKRARPFRFFEGPPTANAGPGIHHVLSRVFKDIICRYKTMRGFLVERKAGWDTHGLPVELQIEKELGIQHKAEIEKFGIAEFNKKAKESVWRYKDEWERFTDRIGFWLDMAHPYITYDTPYMETLWHIIAKFWKRGLLEEDYKVVPYCPRCETPLSSHEVAQGYRTTRDPSIYIKLRLKAPKEYLLVWTTTPWTLPANVAVAANPKVTYTKYKVGDDFYWSATPPPFSDHDPIEVIEKRAGKSLIGLKYEPIFRQKIENKKSKIAYRVVAGDFVSTEEGTGLVHIAPAFGEDDMAVAKKEGLPVVLNIGHDGTFAFTKQELARESFFKKIAGKFVKTADPIIFEELERRGILYRGELAGVEHEYPFCWRCDTPLLYYSRKSWFVKMTRLRDELVRLNSQINWIPAHMKEGRFGEWLREVKDWAFSRDRYWGTPLPIWVCAKCGKKDAIGSRDELNLRAYQPNTFFVMRHGEADHNVHDYIAAWPEPKRRISRLTEKGEQATERAAKALAKKRIDLIVSSDQARMKETARILKRSLTRATVLFDKRLRELDCGIFNYRRPKDHHKFFKKPVDEFTVRPPGGENLTDAQMRYFAVYQDLQKKYRGKKILILGHGDPLWVFEGKIRELSPADILAFSYIDVGEWRELPANYLPYNDEGEVDLHRPYVDAIELTCAKCRGPMRRVKEVTDVWYDSGAMPFAQWHWPFENKERISEGKSFPADYIAEAVDQTRGWFYTLLAVSTALGFKTPPYLNVISLGHILDEKGKKMSKSKGNIVNPWDMMEKYGADAIRWYFFTVNPPGEPKRFSERDLAKHHQELMLLLNVLRFFTTYAPRKIHPDPFAKKLASLDTWILGRLAELTAGVGAELDRFEVAQAGRKISEFLDDLSRWYVRRSRRRFQRPRSKADLAVAASVLGTVLADLAKLMAPFTPFVAEHVWKETTERFTGRKFPESIHLTNWPKPRAVAGQAALIEKMAAAREIASLALKLRQESGIKVRQPLKKLSVLETDDSVRLDSLGEILRDEVNVKGIEWLRRLPEATGILQGKTDKWHVALDTRLTDELVREGRLRELVRHIQELRQKLNLETKDTIEVFLEAPADVFGTAQNLDFIRKEVNAKKITPKKSKPKLGAEYEYTEDGAKIWVAIKKYKTTR